MGWRTGCINKLSYSKLSTVLSQGAGHFAVLTEGGKDAICMCVYMCVLGGSSVVTISTSSFLQPFFGFSRGFYSQLIQPAAENGTGWPGEESFKAKTKAPPTPEAFITIKNCWSTSTLAKSVQERGEEGNA